MCNRRQGHPCPCCFVDAEASQAPHGPGGHRAELYRHTGLAGTMGVCGGPLSLCVALSFLILQAGMSSGLGSARVSEDSAWPYWCPLVSPRQPHPLAPGQPSWSREGHPCFHFRCMGFQLLALHTLPSTSQAAEEGGQAECPAALLSSRPYARKTGSPWHPTATHPLCVWSPAPLTARGVAL